MTRSPLRAEIDGVSENGAQVIYDVRLDGGGACVAGVTATLSPERHGGKTPAPAPRPKGATPALSTAAFVRVDLVGKRAEGGDRGLPPAAVRRMTCALGAKP